MIDPETGRESQSKSVRIKLDTFRRLQQFVEIQDMDKLKTRPDDVIWELLNMWES